MRGIAIRRDGKAIAAEDFFAEADAGEIVKRLNKSRIKLLRGPTSTDPNSTVIVACDDYREMWEANQDAASLITHLREALQEQAFIAAEKDSQVEQLQRERDFQEMGWRNQTRVAERLREALELVRKGMEVCECPRCGQTFNPPPIK